MYKCINDKGRTEFSDRPCALNAEKVEMHKQPSTQTTTTHRRYIRLEDGNIQPFIKVQSMKVGAQDDWGKDSSQGLVVVHNGIEQEIAFEDLISMRVLNFDSRYCRTVETLCKPTVEIKTRTKTFQTNYKWLLKMIVLIKDDLSGKEKDLTVYFGKQIKHGKITGINIRTVQFNRHKQ